MIAAHQIIDIASGVGIDEPGGKPNNFWVPCSMKSRAVTIRSTARKVGA